MTSCNKFSFPAPELNNNIHNPCRTSEKDVVLITYGDQVVEPHKPPLQTLNQLLCRYAKGTINSVHILPFMPYSSDDGFSVIDYASVDPNLGSWTDIQQIAQDFDLMVDLVVNHASTQSSWFQQFLADNPEFEDYFIWVEPGTDLSRVVRPRAQPLLTPFQTASGEHQVWTTFGPDQADLNYHNPEILLKMIEILLLYVEKGARIIRLDAIAYLWKETGSPSIHLPQTHSVVKLFRCVLDAVAPGVQLVTETNVPHLENISYFGNGSDEAQMVYQFPLPPLVLYTFLSGNASDLSRWASDVSLPSNQTTFFNFLASHDGIGLRPVEGILSPDKIQALVERTLAHGGCVSFKSEADGSQSAYELNISYFDALSDPSGAEPISLQVQRFMASQAILLSLVGVPGIYIHSLFGSRSDYAGIQASGRYRSVNREKFHQGPFEATLAQAGTTGTWFSKPTNSSFVLAQPTLPFTPTAGSRLCPPNPACW